MFVKPCPICHRMPKITQGVLRKNGNRFYMIGCPNYHCVLEPDPRYDDNFLSSSTHAVVEAEAPDYNTIYKVWNERLIENV